MSHCLIDNNRALLLHIQCPRQHVLTSAITQDLENNPAIIVNDYPAISPSIDCDTVEILARGSIEPQDIDAVVFSHLHFDHTGDCTRFPQAKMIVGPGSRAFTTPGFPKDPKSPFFSDILDHPHFHELQFKPDSGIASFEHAHDFFGDGSLYLVDTPGHMPGHLAAVAQTGDDEWVFMGGDCCHHRALLLDRRPMSVTMGPNGTKSFHASPNVAKQTIGKVRMLEEDDCVFVALPHDATLDAYMPLFPDVLNGWKHAQWKETLDKHVSSRYPS